MEGGDGMSGKEILYRAIAGFLIVLVIIIMSCVFILLCVYTIHGLLGV